MDNSNPWQGYLDSGAVGFGLSSELLRGDWPLRQNDFNQTVNQPLSRGILGLCGCHILKVIRMYILLQYQISSSQKLSFLKHRGVRGTQKRSSCVLRVPHWTTLMIGILIFLA